MNIRASSVGNIDVAVMVFHKYRKGERRGVAAAAPSRIEQFFKIGIYVRVKTISSFIGPLLSDRSVILPSADLPAFKRHVCT